MNDFEEQNRRSWNAATLAHNSHKGDQALFLRQGGSTLFPEELALLGDVRGRTLLHLQCNAGQDSLSLAALGAVVTGVDIADEAIAFAQGLSRDSGIPATFHRAEVVDWLQRAAADGQRYDVVFVSYGALCWLPDLGAWAKGVAAVLRPGGRLVVMEFHPFAMVFDPAWRLTYDYFNPEPMVIPDGVGDYVADSGDGLVHTPGAEGVTDFVNPHPSVEFAWGIGQVVNALLAAGLRIARLEEYPFANGWKGFDGMREGEGKRWYAPPGQAAIPLMYGLEALQP